MVLLLCPKCGHKWDFMGKPRGNKHKVRCPKVGCRVWFSMSEQEWQKWREIHGLVKSKLELTVELLTCMIRNRGSSPEKPEYSEVKVNLRISNPTKETIGVSKMLINSRDRDYPIAVHSPSFMLKPEETRLVRLSSKYLPPIPSEKKFVPAIIEIYNTRNEIMKKIPVKLYIGYLSGID